MSILDTSIDYPSQLSQGDTYNIDAANTRLRNLHNAGAVDAADQLRANLVAKGAPAASLYGYTPPAGPGAGGAPPASGPTVNPLTGQPDGPLAGDDQGPRDAQARIMTVLRQYNFSAAQTQSLSTFVWNELINGRGQDTVTNDLYTRPEFEQRFPAIKELLAKGLPPISPAEYVATEKSFEQIARASNLPQGFYDQPEDFHGLIANGVSPTEFGDRIQQGFQRVDNAPQAVRDLWGSWYGAQGRTALAALFLDPDKALPALERMTESAMIGGKALGYGLGLSQQTAEAAAGLGLSDFRIDSALGQAQNLLPLTNETVTESRDLTGEDAAASMLGLSPASQDAFRQRQLERTAAFAGDGGSILTRQGAAGLGVADTNR